MDIDVKKPLKYFKKPLLIRRFTKRKVSKAGRPPGTLVHTGETKVDQIKISVIDYSSEKLTEREAKNVEDCFPFKKTSTVTWINITGLHEVNIIEKLGTHFGLHPLLLEDILNTQQRPKLEDFEAYMFLVLRMLTYNEISNSVNSEQVSFVIGKNFVISFQEAEGDVFEPVRLRIRKSKGRFRKSGPDYLAYALIDAVIDNYFLILEKLGEKIEDLEEQLALEPKQEYL